MLIVLIYVFNVIKSLVVLSICIILISPIIIHIMHESWDHDL